MRRAMLEAELGDDVFGDDPTVNRLQARAAEIFGFEDALFFPSGTQANQTGIALVTEPGTELLLEANAHLVHSEAAGIAALSGVQIRPITTPDGLLTADLVRGALRAPSPHFPRITALAIENSHNTAGGRVLHVDGRVQCNRVQKSIQVTRYFAAEHALSDDLPGAQPAARNDAVARLVALIDDPFGVLGLMGSPENMHQGRTET